MAEVWIALPLYGGRAMEPEGAEWTTSPLVIDRMRYRSDGVGYRPHGHTHVFVMPADGGTPRQLTSRASDHGGESSHDGRPVQGWLAKPPGFDPSRKYPLILEIHGGPFANYGPRFAPEVQLYAAAGYLVLYTNPRGSTSYGGEFGNLIHHAYPGDDYHDLVSGVDAVIAEGYVDEGNLMVTGGSGGGVLSAWIVGRTDRFRAAVVQKPVIDWISFSLTSDGYSSYYQYWFPAPVWEEGMLEHYWDRSPLSLVGNVTTPTMLITGEEDLRTPMGETEQFYQALQIRGVPTRMVRVQDAYHGMASSSPSNLINKIAYVLDWLESHRVRGVS